MLTCYCYCYCYALPSLLPIARHLATPQVCYASSLSSVTEAAKTPLFHLSEEGEGEAGPEEPRGRAPHSAPHKRRVSKGRGKLTPRDPDLYLGGGAGAGGDGNREPDAVHAERGPASDELDLIDILRARHPAFLTLATVGNEAMLLVVYAR
jgi:hypothetical protein